MLSIPGFSVNVRSHTCKRENRLNEKKALFTNIPHTIYSGGNLLVACRKKKTERKTDFYLKIITEFQTMFKLNCN